MRVLIRLAILGLAAYGAKTLYDQYGSSIRSAAAPSAPTAVHSPAHAPGRVDPNSPAAQADDLVAVSMQTPTKMS